MQTPRDFHITVTPDKFELEGQGGKFVFKYDEIDHLIASLEQARDCGKIARQVSQLPIGKPHLTLVKS